jgi:hypothetical protein
VSEQGQPNENWVQDHLWNHKEGDSRDAYPERRLVAGSDGGPQDDGHNRNDGADLSKLGYLLAHQQAEVIGSNRLRLGWWRQLANERVAILI